MRVRSQTQAALFAVCAMLHGANSLALADGYYDSSWAGGGRLTFKGDGNVANTSDLEQIIALPSGNLRLYGRVSTTGDSWLGEMQPDGTWSASFGGGAGPGRVALCPMQTCTAFTAGAIQASTGNNVIIGSPYLVGVDSAGQSYYDNQYSTTGGIDATLGSVTPNTLASLPDGRIIIAGYGYATTDTTRALFGVARLTQDLSLDTSFNSATTGFHGGAIIDIYAYDAFESVHDVLIQPDGRVILVGFANGEFGTALEAVRLNSDGTLDNSFGTGGVSRLTWSEGNIDATAKAVLDRAGRIVVALSGTTLAFNQEIMLAARLTASGALDPGFGPGAGFAQFSASKDCPSIYAKAVAIDSAGRILVAGDCANSVTDDFIVARFRGDTGYLDASFGISGYSLGEFEAGGSGSPFDIVLDSGGRPIVGGTSDSSGKAGIARLTYDLIQANNFESTPRGCLPPDCN